jgi:predicted aconitase
MFHIQGVTPEAHDFEDLQPQLKKVLVQPAYLLRCWEELNTAKDPAVQLVALGNPHFALDEFVSLASLCSGRKRGSSTSLIITTSRDIFSEVCRAGLLGTLEEFGAEIITDTCWCMIREPVIAPDVGNIMTNSAKYAHYAPGLVRRDIHFGGLEECMQVACDGQRLIRPPPWLTRLLPN